MARLVFVDCEAYGGCPAVGRLTEFGAVLCPDLKAQGYDPPRRAVLDETTPWLVDLAAKAPDFHGVIVDDARPSTENPAVPMPSRYWPDDEYARKLREVFVQFDNWLELTAGGARVVFVSDNPAFDWQWINDGMWCTLGANRFGRSARRIGDFYAGLRGNHLDHSTWKRLRVTPHTYHPVDDARGNLEAFLRMLAGER